MHFEQQESSYPIYESQTIYDFHIWKYTYTQYRIHLEIGLSCSQLLSALNVDRHTALWENSQLWQTFLRSCRMSRTDDCSIAITTLVSFSAIVSCWPAMSFNSDSILLNPTTLVNLQQSQSTRYGKTFVLGVTACRFCKMEHLKQRSTLLLLFIRLRKNQWWHQYYRNY